MDKNEIAAFIKEQLSDDIILAALPIGTLSAYAGHIFWPNKDNLSSHNIDDESYERGVKNAQTLAKKGWLKADGTAISPFDPQIGDLNLILQFGWGGQSPPATYFRLPDLQGVFVRGVCALNSTKDPDAHERIPLYPGGNFGYAPGSYQEDGFGKHLHATALHHDQPWGRHGGSAQSIVGTTSASFPLQNSGSTGGKETRSRNVYVNWIIKASNKPIILEDLKFFTEDIQNGEL